MKKRSAEIIGLIHKEVKPATGCTEPIAVALAAARAAELLGERCPCCSGAEGRLRADLEVCVEVSGNILKNGMGVGIPGTGMVGLYIAAALGAVCGQSQYGLEVLHELGAEGIARAKELVAGGAVHIGLAHTDKKLYVKASVKSDRHHRQAGVGCHCACAIIADDHDNIVETSFDGSVLRYAGGKEGQEAPQKETRDYGLTVREILDFASTEPLENISFILDSRRLNLALAEEGLRGEYGLKVGRTILCSGHKDVFGDDFMSYAMAMTAAASDARMAGCTLPAMSNSGSGNQGLTVTMPVIAYAIKHNVSDERLTRALVLSHLIAIHIKGYLGKLSALCGCVVASTGSACGLVYLKGGGYEQVCAAIKNMIGNITGMVCDGAKVGCAMKVASGVASSIQSAVLAMDGICISENDGIIDRDIEKTIQNLGRIGSVGMQSTDSLILDIMVCK